jgi:hypothetical protein
MKVSQDTGCAQMGPMKYLSQSDQFGAMYR